VRVGAIKRSNHKSCRRRETPPTFMTNKVNETKVKSKCTTLKSDSNTND
jgi:hypothetical protein